MKVYLSLAFVIFAFLCNAQVQEKQDPKVVKDKKTGEIYWNRKLPVYINLSTKPNGEGQKVQLKKVEKEAPQAYYFDCDGANFIRTKWKTDENGVRINPPVEVLWRVNSDGTAPTTKIHYHYNKKHIANGIIYYDKNLEVSFSSMDAISGVEKTMFSSNKEEYKKYQANQRIKFQAGENNLKVYSVDRVGNVEAIKDNLNDHNFVVDEKAPETTHKITGPQIDNIISPKCVIKLTAQDDKSGVRNIKYHQAGDDFKLYGKGIYARNLNAGVNVLTYKAEDYVGNVEQEKTHELFIDDVAPEPTFAFDKDMYISSKKVRYSSKRAIISFEASDNKAGVKIVEYSFDGHNFVDAKEKIDLQYVQSTFNKVYYRATDKVENRSAVKFFTYYIDNSAPKIKWNTPDKFVKRRDTIFVKSSSRIKLKAYEITKVNSGVKELLYSINDGVKKVYNGEFNITKEGHNKLTIWAYDNVNNKSEVSYDFFVDDKAPEIFNHYSVETQNTKHTGNKTNKVFPKGTFIYLAAEDNVVGNEVIYYSINGGKEKKYTHPISGLKANKDYEIVIKAIDLLGNTSTKTISFSIE